MVDAHQHFWDPAHVPLPWLRPEHAPIARPFMPADLAPELRAAGVRSTVLVQSANSDADTDLALALAAGTDWIGAVVGWVALADPARTDARLAELAARPALRGIRHLIHDEADAHWILQPEVLASIALLEEQGLVLELPAVFPRHLGDVPLLAERFPQLPIVVDHLGKPPLDGDLRPWGHALARAAEAPNVHAKLSGLNTATGRPDWTADTFAAAFETAIELFGAERLLWGSDWPVLLLNGDYGRVRQASGDLLAGLAPRDRELVLDVNATRLYGLGVSVGAH